MKITTFNGKMEISKWKFQKGNRPHPSFRSTQLPLIITSLKASHFPPLTGTIMARHVTASVSRSRTAGGQGKREFRRGEGQLEKVLSIIRQVTWGRGVIIPAQASGQGRVTHSTHMRNLQCAFLLFESCVTDGPTDRRTDI